LKGSKNLFRSSKKVLKKFKNDKVKKVQKLFESSSFTASQNYYGKPWNHSTLPLLWTDFVHDTEIYMQLFNNNNDMHISIPQRGRNFSIRVLNLI